MDILITNKDVRKVKNIVHIAVHFPMGMSKVCNKIILLRQNKRLDAQSKN